MRIIHALAGPLLVGLTACAGIPPEPDAVYYLVRHAEKQKDVSDPGLTQAGIKRAQALADRLKDTSLTAIYSTDYKRTRDTAGPTALSQGMSVTSYDPGALDNLAGDLLVQKGYYLLVGHSNTTPDLVRAFGGEAGPPIIEVSEYNRLYILTRRGDIVTTDMTTYGDANE